MLNIPSTESVCEQPLYFSHSYHFNTLNDMVRSLKKVNGHNSPIAPQYRNAILDCRAVIEEFRYDEYRSGLLATYLFLFLPGKEKYSSKTIKNLRRYRRDKINTWLETGAVNMYEEGCFLGQWFKDYEDLNLDFSKSIKYLVERCNCIKRRSDICSFLAGLYEKCPNIDKGDSPYLGLLNVQPLNFMWDKNLDYDVTPFLNLTTVFDNPVNVIFDLCYRIVLHQKIFFKDPKIQNILSQFKDYDKRFVTDEGEELNQWLFGYNHKEEDKYLLPLYELESWMSYDSDVLTFVPDGLLKNIPLKALHDYPKLCAELEKKYDFSLLDMKSLLFLIPDLTIQQISTHASITEETLHI